MNEYIRDKYDRNVINEYEKKTWFERIMICKMKKNPIDIDKFSKVLMKRDKSTYTNLELLLF